MENLNPIVKPLVKRSDLIILYHGKMYIPNGDPFTGEQRIDAVTGSVLISGERIKRYFRDYVLYINRFLEDQNLIYVRDITDKELQDIGLKEGTSAAAHTAILKKLFEKDPTVFKPGKKKPKKEKKGKEATSNPTPITDESEIVCDLVALLCKCLDTRLYGCISTDGDSVTITGPVQFPKLNPSLNPAARSMRDHQNTSVFKSSVEKGQGSIGTCSLVPYSINQIVGWVSPGSALDTGLKEEEVMFMLDCIWKGINAKNTSSKCNQSSVLTIKINHKDSLSEKIDDMDMLIKINPVPGKTLEDIRSIEDYTFDFSKLATALTTEHADVESVEYRCHNPIVSQAFTSAMPKSLTLTAF